MKRATTDERPGLLDPWLLAYEEERRKSPAVLPHRARMGLVPAAEAIALEIVDAISALPRRGPGSDDDAGLTTHSEGTR